MRLLVVNPYASGVNEDRIADVTAALGDVEVRRTEHRGHATELVRQHPDAEAVRRIEDRGRHDDGARSGNLTFAWELARLVAQRRGRFEPALEVLGRGRAAFALVANGDPYTYAGPIPVRIAPDAEFELGLDLVAPRAVSPFALPRLLGYALLGRGQSGAGDVLYAHDLDRIEVVCDAPMPLQADGEDLGDVTSAVFEAERGAVTVLV